MRKFKYKKGGKVKYRDDGKLKELYALAKEYGINPLDSFRSALRLNLSWKLVE